MESRVLVVSCLLLLFVSGFLADIQSSAVSDDQKKWSCTAGLTLSDILSASGFAANVTSSVDGSSIWAGIDQATSINQNVIYTKFDSSGDLEWCRNDVDTNPDDGRGVALAWDDSQNQFYLGFTTDGGNNNFGGSSFATSGWIPKSQIGGGGSKRSGVALISTTDGAPTTTGTYINALLSSGNANTWGIVDMTLDSSGNVFVRGSTAFAPRNRDKSRKDCEGPSGFDHVLQFTANLQTATLSCAKLGPFPGTPSSCVQDELDPNAVNDDNCDPEDAFPTSLVPSPSPTPSPTPSAMPTPSPSSTPSPTPSSIPSPTP
eukprot:CAMPEP_0201508088 /NCGR_PEP_ID=MMETSP0161_2-20130828/1548_1 /ASSEMBLY_ACC=CAM_ASM_000251 /TAXON_ID=180227 /ORGANISM="Neoparamoeba aestuarina, Strain SoJaBio B1-5/56/2" /LENGTH=316 /DNA_ID=CAMNT_0047902627 /DNA_START=333 /DNA_END=1279 /DNA_ORIENTATION=+